MPDRGSGMGVRRAGFGRCSERFGGGRSRSVAFFRLAALLRISVRMEWQSFFVCPLFLFSAFCSRHALPAEDFRLFFGEPRKDARMLSASCPALFPMRALTAGNGSCIISEMMLSAFELFAMDLRPAFRSFRTNALLPACMTQKLYAGERFFVIWDIRKKTFLHI